MTETPFIIDDFEDNDMYNNINPPNNAWASYSNIPDAASNTYPVFFFGIAATGGLGSSHGLLIEENSYANNPDGSGNYFASYGMATPLLFSPGTGVDFTKYSTLIFSLEEYVWDVPSAGTYSFKVKLLDNSGRYLEHDITNFVLNDWNLKYYSLGIGSFIVPAGVSSYTAADVLPNIVEIRWEYKIVSTLNGDFSDSTMTLDGIFLSK